MMLALTMLAATAAATARHGHIDAARFATFLLLGSAAALSLLPQPLIVVGGVLAIPSSILLEAGGVAAATYMLYRVVGFERTLGLLLLVLAIAVPADALIYFGTVDRLSLSVSAIYNTVVVAPSILLLIYLHRKSGISISV